MVNKILWKRLEITLESKEKKESNNYVKEEEKKM